MSCWPVLGLGLCRWEKTCAVIDFAPVRGWSTVTWSKTVSCFGFFFFGCITGLSRAQLC